MSSGAYHYIEAEKLVESARAQARERASDGSPLPAAVLDRVLIALNAASVHASLAQTAAEVEASGLNTATDWHDAITDEVTDEVSILTGAVLGRPELEVLSEGVK